MPGCNNTDNRSKAVVAYLDGRRQKGYICDFSPQKDCFRLFPEQNGQHPEGAEVQMSELKAIFFDRNFAGNSADHDSEELAQPGQGGRAEVTFHDGEKIVGDADAYDPQRKGFFVVPSDPRSGNLRVFIIAKNAQQIRWI
jgi:hypothetical protein